MKSKALANCLAGEMIEITHIYGSDKFKQLLKEFHVDIHEKIRILSINDNIIFLNNEQQQLSLSFSEAYDIFGINAIEHIQTIHQRKKKLILWLSTLLMLQLLFIGAYKLFHHLTHIQFSLKANNITLSYGQHFDAQALIQELKNAKVILPVLNDRSPGTYKLNYLAKNNFKQKQLTLMVNIIDDQAPTITLTHEKLVYEDGLQDCHYYIQSVDDNVDKLPKTQVACSNELDFADDQAAFIYTISDKAGNIAQASLPVIKKPQTLKPVASIDPPRPSNHDQQIMDNHINQEIIFEEISEESYSETITYDEGVLVSYE
ncbi:MAG: hypothetical protein MR210_09305 [Erysipelotrichaceae bacterium]|nr:hypothetical protein [Erysipelotrichaceae bacterium]MDY5251516.1 hypothetical protein [Erysipelotrichaceae bacterium]